MAVCVYQFSIPCTIRSRGDDCRDFEPFRCFQKQTNYFGETLRFFRRQASRKIGKVVYKNNDAMFRVQE
tara:strand:+ start:596 stop:802 length:207 start_codon:yes stop_codon:yes gene_type:complete